MYLARIAIAESYRGTSLASNLLAGLIETAGDEGVSLHVRADNRRAIALYQRRGFNFVDDEGKDYRIMERR
jgi:ribosomal protein S18 acetylase RimI-like enzyme